MTKNIGLCFIFLSILGALTACSQQDSPFSRASETVERLAQNAPSPASSKGFENTPIVAPPSFNERPLEPGQTQPPESLPNGLPALKPLKGVNVDTLFSESISNTDKRFDRLENAVTDMRKEFETVKPAIVRLVAVEEDIQTLVEQLEILANEEAKRPPAPIAPTQLSPTTPPTDLKPQDAAGPVKPQSPKTPPPKTVASGTSVKNLRLGQHKDKIRLVLDANRKTPFSFELDNGENFLLIELPEAGWQGAKSKTFSSKTPLVKSYEVESINGGKGTRIIVTLKKQTSLLKKQAIPPGSVSPNYRIFVDLKL